MSKYNNKKIFLIGIISFFVLQAYSQSSESDRKYVGKNHRGFFLSYAPGINLTNVSMDDIDGFSTVKGLGGAMDLKIGGTLKENLILHATILSHGVFEPKIYDRNSGQNGTRAHKVDFGEVMIGAGVTCYTPANFLFSTSVGFGGFIFSNEEKEMDGSSDNGFSFQLKMGKEWWISPKLGLGLALYYHKTNVLNLAGTTDEERLKSNNLGMALSATFNGKKKQTNKLN